MNRLFSRANKRISLGGAATLLISTAMIGQVLGFLRTKLVNANFSALGPQSTDAYFAAFKIPDFFFYTLAAGALGVAFMPILAEHAQRSDRKGVWELTDSLMNLLAIIMAAVGVIIMIFAPQLIHYIVAPKLSPEQLHNASTIMRLIALNPLLFTISGIITSVQQTYGRFFFYAIAPLFYNLSIIASIFLFKDNIGLIGLGIGACLGAVLQLAVVFMGLGGMGFRWRPKINWKNNDFKLILRQLPPRSLDQGIDSVNSIVETNFARRLGEGNVSYFENAYALHTPPTLLIGTAISTAAFPRLTERLAQGRTDLFRKEFIQVLRAIIWIAIPVVLISYFGRGYLARMIFTRDAPEIALIFGYLAGAIFFRTLYSILSRWFYAQKDTKTPLFVSLFAIALNVYLAYTLSRPSAYGVSGLAMAQSIVAGSEVVILFTVMSLRDSKLYDKTFWAAMLKIAAASGFTMMSSFLFVSLLPLNTADRGIITLGTKLGIISLVTIGVHVVASWVFSVEESRPIVERLKKIASKPIRIQY